MISLLHPSRSRIERSKETIDKWRSRAGQNAEYEIIISIDSDDNQKLEYQLHYGEHYKVLVNDNRSAIDAINKAAERARGNIMIVVSDDTDVPQNWYEKIISATNGREDFILKVNDGIQKWIITMPVMDRKYYNRFGYIYQPDYKHCFCDTEMTHVADALKKIIFRDDLRFPHEHYCVGKAKKDQINERADATWQQGMQLYLRRVRERFGLDPSIDIYNLSGNADNHLKWLKSNL